MRLEQYRQIRDFLEEAYNVIEDSRISTPSGNKKPLTRESDKLLLEQIVDSISLTNALIDEFYNSSLREDALMNITALEKLRCFWPDFLIKNALTNEEFENARESRSYSEWKILDKKLFDYKAGLSTEKGV